MRFRSVQKLRADIKLVAATNPGEGGQTDSKFVWGLQKNNHQTSSVKTDHFFRSRNFIVQIVSMASGPQICFCCKQIFMSRLQRVSPGFRMGFLSRGLNIVFFGRIFQVFVLKMAFSKNLWLRGFLFFMAFIDYNFLIYRYSSSRK